jgi:predicted amidohydrolase
MKVAAYQSPLLPAGSLDALALIRNQVHRCEAEGVTLLCCPEAILGGLADNAEHPTQFAIPAARLEAALQPLASNTVTTIVGFTEQAESGQLYNAAAVFHRGSVIGLYRKLYPAIRRSVYEPGRKTSVFHVEGLTFGILICNDSNHCEPARRMAAQGAAALFVPTNNALPPSKAGAELAAEARSVDIARAIDNHNWVIRADVAGRLGELASHGSSGIVDPDGAVVQSAQPLTTDLLIAEISPQPRAAAAAGTPQQIKASSTSTART